MHVSNLCRLHAIGNKSNCVKKPEINQSLHSGFIDFGASSLGVFKAIINYNKYLAILQHRQIGYQPQTVRLFFFTKRREKKTQILVRFDIFLSVRCVCTQRIIYMI